MIHKLDVVKIKVKSCALQKPCYNLNLPFDLVFIEFCFTCWCFDFQDCNFLTSRFIIGDGLSSFRTVLSFLSMTSRFPFIFVFWKCVTSYRSNADDTTFLAPTRAQGVTMSMCLSGTSLSRARRFQRRNRVAISQN